jgi:hypothetical protein
VGQLQKSVFHGLFIISRAFGDDRQHIGHCQLADANLCGQPQGDDLVCPPFGAEGSSLSTLEYWRRLSLSRFAASLLDLKDLLADRGVTVSQKTIRV